MPPLRRLIYTFLYIASAILGVIKFSLFAKLLGTEQFGLYSLVLSIYVFIVYAGGMGLNESIIKLGSYAYGRGEFEQLYTIYSSSALFGGIITVFIGAAFSLSIFLAIDNTELASALALSSLLAFAALQFNFFDAYLRASQKLLTYAFILVAKASLVILGGMSVAKAYGAYGVIVAESAVFLSISIISQYFFYSRYGIRASRFSWTLAKEAIRNGFPLMSSYLIRTVSLSLDKWLIASSLGLVALGKYSFAMIVYLAATLALGFLGTILGPKWLASFAVDRNALQLLRSTTKIIIIISGSLALLLPLTYIITPLLIENFFPAFNEIEVFHSIIVIYISAIFLTPSIFLEWLYIAKSREKFIFRIYLYNFIFSVIVLTICWGFSLSIIYYALSFLASRVFTLIIYISDLRAYPITKPI